MERVSIHPRHPEVADHGVDSARACRLERRRTVRCHHDAEPAHRAEGLHSAPQGRLVVDEEQPDSCKR